jgi:ATP-binding cassette subfamily C protein
VTAIAGPSGAGKSTIADLLLGLLRPTGGRMLVDGHALAESDLGAWRRSIGYVPQDSFLLHDTVRANLRWARPGATDEQMWDALERSAAAGVVRARPEGLDTVIGDRGVRLSGGERQRLALARALITAPDVLVLDEATSALDSVNERQILRAVQNLRGRVTVVVITHRLSTIRDADLVHVVEQGRVVESGTWAELAGKRGGAFEALLALQRLDGGGQASGEDATAVSAS